MSKNLLHAAMLTIFIILLNGTAYSAGEWFRSKANGSWYSTSTWDMSTNGGSTWIPATISPTLVSSDIYIEPGTTVQIPAGETWTDQLTIKNGGTLNCEGNL